MTAVDRSRLPPVTSSAPATFPAVRRVVGAGGLHIWTVPHRRTELVTLALLIPAGAAADPAGCAGLAGFTADLLDDGTRARNGIELHEALGRLGARFGGDVSSDATVLSVSALPRHAGDVLALLLEVATEPRFDGADVDRVRALRLNRIAQLRHAAGVVADRAWRRVLYGEHPYGHSALGETGTLSPLGGDDVRAFHAAHYRLDRATLIIAGDDAALEAAVQRAGGGGTVGRAPLPLPDPPADPAPPSVRLTFIPREGAVQSEIRVGHLGIARSADDFHAVRVMDMVLGGQFTSRLNMNLREARGYTYGVRSTFDARRGRGPFDVATAVDAAVTADAIRETIDELRAIRDSRPITGEELAIAKPALTLGFPRAFETSGQVARGALRLALFDLPDDEYTKFVPRVEAVDAAAATAAARRRLDPDALAVVVVGPPEVRPSLGGLGLGEPVEATPDGAVAVRP